MTDRGAHDPDRELDEALAALHLEARMSDRPLTDARERLLQEAATPLPTPPWFRRRGFVVGVAAAAAVLVGGGVVVATTTGSPTPGGGAVAGSTPGNATGSTPGSATPSSVAKKDVSLLSASKVLNEAADKVTGKDLEIGPGQYRYLELKAVNSAIMNTGTQKAGEPVPQTGYTYLVEHVTRRWIPQDVTQEWLEKRSVGSSTLIGSSMPASEVPAYVPQDVESGDRSGLCGDFFPKAKPKKVCGDPADPDQPTFYEALPRDPDQLFGWLEQISSRRDSPSSWMFHYAINLLNTGLVPADLRGPLFRAMAKIDGVQVVEEATTPDGRTGLALGFESDLVRRDLIVDPATGDMIGEREVAGPKPEQPWIKPGTVVGYTSVTTKVADAIGVVPAG